MNGQNSESSRLSSRSTERSRGICVAYILYVDPSTALGMTHLTW